MEDTVPETLRLASSKLPHLYHEYLAEMAQHLDLIEANAHELRTQPSDAACLNALFRSFHSIKGNSAFHKLEPIQNLAHSFETLLDSLRERQVPFRDEIIPLIFTLSERLRHALHQMEQRVQQRDLGTPVPFLYVDLLVALDRIYSPDGGPAVEIFQPKILSPSVSSNGSGAGKIEAETSLNVPASKISRLFDLIGQLAIAQSLLRREAEISGTPNPRVQRQMLQLARVTTDLQKSTLSLRTLRLRSLFQKLQRVAEGVAVELGKSARLVCTGEQIELDRAVLERISDPLLHMVRNALDHGLESDEERKAAGKPVPATIHLTAMAQGPRIILELHDDGRGLDRRRILEKALEKKLIDYTSARLSDEKVFALIFHPGFSTAKEVSAISGRGVGMDVVKTALDQLHATIQILSEYGRGTTFHLEIPSSADMLQGCLFTLRGQKYLIAQSAYRGFFPLPEGTATEQENGVEWLTGPDGRAPFIRLAAWLDPESVSHSPDSSVVLRIHQTGRLCYILIDRVLAEQENVYKILGSTFRKNRLLSSAGLSEDGQVTLILDVEILFSLNAA